MDILCGIEWDLLSEGKPTGYDYWIGSAHHLYGKNTGKYYEIDFRPQDLRDCISNDFDGDPLAAVEAYFAEVEKVAAKKPDILAHIDLHQEAERGRRASLMRSLPATRPLPQGPAGRKGKRLPSGGEHRRRIPRLPQGLLPRRMAAGRVAEDGRQGHHHRRRSRHRSLTFGFDEAAAAIKAAGFTSVDRADRQRFEQQEVIKEVAKHLRCFAHFNKNFLNFFNRKEATAQFLCNGLLLREERNPMTQTRPPENKPL